jgi:hypothetical protein
MYLVALAWIYVVLMMAVAEGANPNGTVTGAVFTFLGYGAVPVALIVYIGGAPARRRTRRAREAKEASSAQPDGAGHAAGDAVAAEREEP